jgi:hypothetical protein
MAERATRQQRRRRRVGSCPQSRYARALPRFFLRPSDAYSLKWHFDPDPEIGELILLSNKGVFRVLAKLPLG